MEFNKDKIIRFGPLYFFAVWGVIFQVQDNIVFNWYAMLSYSLVIAATITLVTAIAKPKNTITYNMIMFSAFTISSAAFFGLMVTHLHDQVLTIIHLAMLASQINGLLHYAMELTNIRREDKAKLK